jgi:hypothetical protein
MGGDSQVLVFTVPSKPKTGQAVAFVAQASDLARTARIELGQQQQGKDLQGYL